MKACAFWRALVVQSIHEAVRKVEGGQEGRNSGSSCAFVQVPAAAVPCFCCREATLLATDTEVMMSLKPILLC